ncbi:MAG: YigZ family protein [Candidatus Bipolaricaulis sibiricus]|uniref:YigZ family protein n=1 Tax=Bipolaricaulis sibiricus TaxID=2501609 RepID=A0A410FRZ3_BIPS1|nr:MAG: YigZ family protein [Candidatus Bipolaricaulis sibiricus]
MNGISRPAEAKLVRERSRFLAYAVPVTTVAEVEGALDRLRKEHHTARHVPYAYRLRSGEGRASDDGEPSGSAGRPILSLLEGEDLGGVLVAVVRYFGGVKLGVGGLARAYRDAARAALEAAEVRPVVRERRFVVFAERERVGAVLAVARRHEARVLSQRFTGRAEAEIAVPEGNATLFQAAVAPLGEVREVGDA